MKTIDVTTTLGTLRGEQGDGIAIFRGIRYAAPPVGENRFRSPQPAEPWDGVQDATSFGFGSVQGMRRQPAAPPPQPAAGQGGQAPAFGSLFGSEVETSEDCLFLNVWTPAADDAKRPVMVWIHGGAFRMGTGSSPSYEATRLATRGDVVVVSLNYRLGTLGFLAHPELGANYGLQDQVAALQWVQREIAAFGGDPDQVTIFGESAGGKSVECLLAMPSARGLFQRAIAQSTYDPPLDYEPSIRTTENLASELGVSVADLRTVPLEKLQEAEMKSMMAAMAAAQAAGAGAGGAAAGAASGGGIGGGGGPVADGEVLPTAPIDVISAGELAGIPLLIGTTLDESALFGAMAAGRGGELDDAALAQRLAATIAGREAPADLGQRAAEIYRKVRESRGDDTSLTAISAAAQTDKMFRQHSIKVAEAQSAHAPTYMYLFTWQSPNGRLGACHAIELPFVFGTFDAPLARLSGDAPEARALSEKVQDAWLSFAKTGKPEAAGLPEWPAYNTARRATMVLGATCEVEDGPMEDIRRLWADATA